MTACLLLAVCTPTTCAQQWARDLFTSTTHDFQTVARGAKAEFVFPMVNPYKETIHIAGVRASCGCVDPSVVKNTVETWEKGGILVRLNTRTFTGHRSATITVTIDQPYRAEVQLQVNGYIRSDVVFDPGVVQFAQVPQGESAERTLRISYAGRSDWEIRDVLSANTDLEVVRSQLRREGRRVDYQLRVRLKDTAPDGYFADEMILLTNDSRMKQIPVKVEGNVVPSVTVSPASLYLGQLEPGQTVTKQLVIRGKQPFRIQRVECDDGAFDFQPASEAKELHIVPLTFTARSQPGKIVQTIKIVTETGQQATCLATGMVKGSRTIPAQHQDQAR